MTAVAVQPEPTSTAVARRPSQVTLLRPIAPAADVIVAQNETRELIQKALKPGRDFGTIKGTDKPTLYKAGAERVALAFGCFAQFRTLESEIDHDREVKYLKRSKNWNNKFKGDKSFSGWKEEAGISLGLYRYVVECQIVNRETGDVVGSFIGSCSSLESKYIDRPRDVENTILKMAEKRALVGAALTTFGLSDQFTQDVEDLAANKNAHGGGEEAEEADVEIVKDLAWAKAFPLPARNHKHFGEPIDTRDTKELEGFLTWCVDKIKAAGAEGRELAPSDTIVEFKEALTLVLDDRKATAEKDQTRLELEPAKRDLPPQIDPLAPPASKSTSHSVPPPGKVVDALTPVKEDPTSRKALYARIKVALESPAIDLEARDLYKRDMVNGFKSPPAQSLEWWVEKFESLAGATGNKNKQLDDLF